MESLDLVAVTSGRPFDQSRVSETSYMNCLVSRAVDIPGMLHLLHEQLTHLRPKRNEERER